MKKRNIILWIILLIFIDQAVKLIIHQSFMDSNYTIVPDLLEFKPVFNPSYSYWTAKLGANMGVIAHLTMFSLIWAMLIVLYKFYHKVDPKNTRICCLNIVKDIVSLRKQQFERQTNHIFRFRVAF